MKEKKCEKCPHDATPYGDDRDNIAVKEPPTPHATDWREELFDLCEKHYKGEGGDSLFGMFEPFLAQKEQEAYERGKKEVIDEAVRKASELPNNATKSLLEEAVQKERESWINQPANEHDERIRKAERQHILDRIPTGILKCAGQDVKVFGKKEMELLAVVRTLLGEKLK